MEGKQMIAFVIMFVIIAAALAGVGQVFVKRGLNEIGPMGLKDLTKNFFNVVTNKNVFAGFLMYLIAAIFFLTALSQGSLNLVFPLVSLSYVFAAFVSIPVLKESISVMRWAGIVVIVIGTILVGLG